MGESESAAARRNHHVSRLQRLIGENPGHTIGTLAQELRLSASWLERKFKEHAGCCLREHIITERMKHAAHLLATTDQQVKEIADTLGYAHTPSFIRTFLRHHKKTPRQYRNDTCAN